MTNSSNSSICPWCSYALLSQIKHGKQQLYCSHCHEEIPAGIAKIITTPEVSRVSKYFNFSNSSSSSNSSVNFTSSYQGNRAATMTARSVEHKLEATLNQPTRDKSAEEILLDYVAYFISRGKVVVSHIHGKSTYKGRVYQNIGYTPDFEEFWSKLRRYPDFNQLYLEGDIYCFGQFLNGCFEVGDCVRCDLQIPIPLGMHQYQGSCHLCDKHPTISTINLLVVGTPPTNQPLLQKLFDLQGFKVSFIEHPLEITENILGIGIGLVLIYAEISESMSNCWFDLLRHHAQLRDIPIVILSQHAGRGSQNNYDRYMSLEEYFQQALSTESLASSLRYLAHQRDEDQSKLHWLPR